MYRLSGTVVLALALVCSPAFAQDADSGSILDRSPSENVASAASRGPASWVARARARHNQLIASRVTANPQSADLAANPSSGGSGRTGNSGGTSDGGLLDGLAGLLGGGGLSDEKLKNLFRIEMEKAAAFMTEHANFEYVDIDYNEMLADPSQLVPKLNQFLGNGLDEQKMLAVVDPQLYRQRSS